MKPSDFMIGLINFLSILLPGAIATILLLQLMPGLRTLTKALPQEDVFAWVVGFAAAYFAGHVIFLIGSWFDPVYDFIRRRRDPYGGKVPEATSALDALAIALLRKRTFWLKPVPLGKGFGPFVVVDRLRRKTMTKEEYSATNSFQWCRSLLIQRSPAAHKDIEIHEADQKFFRSLVALALIVGIGAAMRQDIFVAGISFTASFVSFLRYYNRRLKTVTLAYIHIITLHRCGGLDFRPLEHQASK